LGLNEKGANFRKNGDILYRYGGGIAFDDA
jgi:hypothetical protein